MHIPPRSPSPPPLDAQALRQERDRAGQLGAWLLTRPFTMGLLRRFWPTPRLRGLRLVTRYDDVREVLSRPDVFQVPWAVKMQLLAPSTQPFALATDDAAEHRRAQQPLMQVFRREDVPRTSSMAARAAQCIIDDADGEIDALKDLISTVPLTVYRDYYGLHALDSDFVLWLMAVSNYTFRKVGPDPTAEGVAIAAAARVAEAVKDAAVRARLDPGGDTIADRLVQLQARLQKQDPNALPDDALHGMLTGMVTGFAPVFTMAGASILEVLLENRKAMAASRRAACDGNDEALARCLLEALRLRPINPGAWRVCAKDCMVAAGTLRATRIRQGETMLVSIQSAMRDAERVRRAGRFDPDRPVGGSMVFGYGMHWCIGAPLAVGALTQTFKPLLLRGFRRAPQGRGRIRRFGAIPEHMSLTLGPR